jgi:hypothetical protein
LNALGSILIQATAKDLTPTAWSRTEIYCVTYSYKIIVRIIFDKDFLRVERKISTAEFFGDFVESNLRPPRKSNARTIKYVELLINLKQLEGRTGSPAFLLRFAIINIL